MKNYAFIIFLLLLTITLNSQSLNPTYAISASSQADTFSGGYTFSYSTAGTPWNGSLISYGGFTNQYDCQISSEYFTGNHIGFRTRNGDNGTWNRWNEIWHSGNLNNVSADLVSRNIGIGVAGPQAGIDIFRSYDTGIPKAIKIMYQGSWGTPQYASNYRFIDIQSTEEGNILGVNAYGMGIGFNPPTYSSPDKLYINGNVGIGTNTPDEKLTVKGKIHTREVRVDMSGPLVPDYVFEENYDLKSLREVEQYIVKNKHLPEIPSAIEIEKNGLLLAQMNMLLLKKVEELTLHLIQQEKVNQEQTNEIATLKKQNDALKLMQERIANLENQLKK